MQNNIFSGLFIGQNLVVLKEVDSTNNFLKSILSNSKPVPEGTVIMAEAQYAGRGQRKNIWHAEPGKNLTISILLKPAFLTADTQFDLTRVVSAGVFDALEPVLGGQLKIKWPNDIYYADKKIGGILIENILQGNRIKNAIVGIGINVNQEKFDSNAGNATSVKQILQKDYDLKKILTEICSHIEGYYLQLKAGKVEVVRNAYTKRLYWLNQEHLFKAAERIFKGTIIKVLDKGLLIIRTGDGEKAYHFKEVEFLNKQI